MMAKIILNVPNPEDLFSAHKKLVEGCSTPELTNAMNTICNFIDNSIYLDNVSRKNVFNNLFPDAPWYIKIFLHFSKWWDAPFITDQERNANK